MSYSIYKLSREDSDDVYYGSTKQTLKKRFKDHKSHGKSTSEGNKRKCRSSKLFETDANVKIELLETCDGGNVKVREAHYIRNFKCINKQIPNRSKKEYKTQWNEQNKEQIKKKRKMREVGDVLDKKRECSRNRDRYVRSHFGIIARAYF